MIKKLLVENAAHRVTVDLIVRITVHGGVAVVQIAVVGEITTILGTRPEVGVAATNGVVIAITVVAVAC